MGAGELLVVSAFPVAGVLKRLFSCCRCERGTNFCPPLKKVEKEESFFFGCSGVLFFCSVVSVSAFSGSGETAGVSACTSAFSVTGVSGALGSAGWLSEMPESAFAFCAVAFFVARFFAGFPAGSGVAASVSAFCGSAGSVKAAGGSDSGLSFCSGSSAFS